MRAIDADALKEEIMECMTVWNEHTDYGQGRVRSYAWVIDLIAHAPTIEISGLPKIHYDRGFIAGYEKGKVERPQGDNKEALFVLNHLFYDCDNMTQKEYDVLLEAIKEADK